MNCAVDAAAAQKRAIGGVDDRVHLQLGDVALPQCDAFGEMPLLEAVGRRGNSFDVRVCLPRGNLFERNGASWAAPIEALLFV